MDVQLKRSEVASFPRLVDAQRALHRLRDLQHVVFNSRDVRRAIEKVKEQQSILLGIDPSVQAAQLMLKDCKLLLEKYERGFAPSHTTSFQCPVLTVRVLEAKQLNKPSIGSSDPFCIVSIIDDNEESVEELKTAMIRGSSNPVFEECDYNFLMTNRTKHVRITVYNNERTTRTFMGVVQLSVPKFGLFWSAEPRWHTLLRRHSPGSRKKGPEVLGALRVQMALSPHNPRFMNVSYKNSAFDCALALGLRPAVVKACNSTQGGGAQGAHVASQKKLKQSDSRQQLENTEERQGGGSFTGATDAASRQKLKKADYKRVVRDKWSSARTGPFVFCDFAPRVFRELRRIFGYTDDEYITSLCQGEIRSIGESKGKSGAGFYITHDRRLFLKTLRAHEHRLLMGMLKDYFHFSKTNPDTFLQRFYGCFTVEMQQGSGVRAFIVINNVFDTPASIDVKFDLKGSSQGRKVKDEEREEYIRTGKTDTILKDLDFEQLPGVDCTLPPLVRSDLLDQLKKDSKFLEKHLIMDYSLLLGVHLNDGTDAPGGNANFGGKAVRFANQEQEEEGKYAEPGPARDGTKRRGLSALWERSKSIFSKKGKVSLPLIRPGEPIAGANGDTFFMGVIDILQPYNVRKKLETRLKSIPYKKGTISCVHPSLYAKRFLNFMESVVVPLEKVQERPGLVDKSKKSKRRWPFRKKKNKNARGYIYDEDKGFEESEEQD